MITYFMRRLIHLSQRGWLVASIVLLNGLNFFLLFSLESRFQALSGVPTFDTQNDLTSNRLLEQLPAYTGDARTAYLLFSAYDFLFPVLAGLTLAVLITLFLQLNTWKLPARLLAWGLPAFALLSILWDWLENIGLLASLVSDGQPFWIGWALLFKQLKLLWLILGSGSLTAAFALLMVNLVSRLGTQQLGAAHRR
ncbi:MAG: hypothetical protein SF162_04010 [bacterium]|nr:hypothetical protein [bacterium]